jgi:hypothetical protein
MNFGWSNESKNLTTEITESTEKNRQFSLKTTASLSRPDLVPTVLRGNAVFDALRRL